jgi:hypothetical protein
MRYVGVWKRIGLLRNLARSIGQFQWRPEMGTKDIIRKCLSLSAIFAIAAAVFFVAPGGMRVMIALVALPVEAFMLAALFDGYDRPVPHA